MFFSSKTSTSRQALGPALEQPGIFPWDWSGQSVKLTIYLYLLPRLRANGVLTFPLPPYAYMACTWMCFFTPAGWVTGDSYATLVVLSLLLAQTDAGLSDPASCTVCGGRLLKGKVSGAWSCYSTQRRNQNDCDADVRDSPLSFTPGCQRLVLRTVTVLCQVLTSRLVNRNTR